MAAAVAAATPWRSPGKEDRLITERNVDSPTSVLFVGTMEVEEQEQSVTSQSTFQCNVDEGDWDPELATGSPLTEFCGGEVLDINLRRKMFESFERPDEIIPWGEWIVESVVDVEAATFQDIKSSQVANFQIGTNKCANAKSPAQQKERTPQAARLLKPRVAWSSSGIRHRLG